MRYMGVDGVDSIFFFFFDIFIPIIKCWEGGGKKKKPGLSISPENGILHSNTAWEAKTTPR